MNNPMAFIDPTGMAAEYNWSTGKYMDNGREVDFAEAMASHGMNANGSTKTDDPPINLYPKSDKTNGSVVAKNRSYKEGDGIFELFGHGNFQGLLYEDEKGVQYKAKTAVAVSKMLMEKSPRWKEAMQKGEKIVLIMYACNTATYEMKDDKGKIWTGHKPIAQLMSESKLFRNVTIIAADGYAIFGKINGRSQFFGIANDKRNGGFVTYQNGVITGKQQQSYIAPGVTRNLPKEKVE
ncbi:hypothetical protein [Sphingobacterium siyangense]|uniref:hypothetical protein n=1 Tax=Sphingobacterium siyangense TaxID=459529 RepID=UPI003A5C6A6E